MTDIENWMEKGRPSAVPNRKLADRTMFTLARLHMPDTSLSVLHCPRQDVLQLDQA